MATLWADDTHAHDTQVGFQMPGGDVVDMRQEKTGLFRTSYLSMHDDYIWRPKNNRSLFFYILNEQRSHRKRNVLISIWAAFCHSKNDDS